MILKIFSVIAVLFLIYIIFFKKNREVNIKEKRNNDISDEMLECPTCSTFVSQKEAILSNGKYYCSKECIK